jgi:hypothetical protein
MAYVGLTAIQQVGMEWTKWEWPMWVDSYITSTTASSSRRRRGLSNSIGRRRARLCPPCFLVMMRTARTHTEADARTHTHTHTRGFARRHATRTLMNTNTQHTRRISLTHRRASICAAPSHSRCWAAGSLGRLPMGRIVVGWAAESIRGRLRVARQDGARTRREQAVRSRVLSYCCA